MKQGLFQKPQRHIHVSHYRGVPYPPAFFQKAQKSDLYIHFVYFLENKGVEYAGVITNESINSEKLTLKELIYYKNVNIKTYTLKCQIVGVVYFRFLIVLGSKCIFEPK